MPKTTRSRRTTTPPAHPPRSQDLPGMDDRALGDLEQIALDYADVRDDRMALTKSESELKQQAIALLKKHHKTHYRRGGIELTLVPGEDTLRVRVKRDDDADAPDAALPADPVDADDGEAGEVAH